MQENTNPAYSPYNSVLSRIVEIVIVFVIGLSFIRILSAYTDGNQILKQAIIWIAYIIMMLLVWLGLRLRGQQLSDFGVTFKKIAVIESLKVFLLSILVFVLALAGFVMGSIIMANITGIPEGADMSNYEYLDNIFMLILTLCGVYIVSSFGEEFIYRGFLINRINELLGNTKLSRIISVLASAIIFGLVHYEWGPMGIVQTSFMGLVLGYFYLRLKKRIWILVLAHAYMDTILMVQVYLSSK